MRTKELVTSLFHSPALLMHRSGLVVGIVGTMELEGLARTFSAIVTGLFWIWR